MNKKYRYWFNATCDARIGIVAPGEGIPDYWLKYEFISLTNEACGVYGEEIFYNMGEEMA